MSQSSSAASSAGTSYGTVTACHSSLPLNNSTRDRRLSVSFIWSPLAERQQCGFGQLQRLLAVGNDVLRGELHDALAVHRRVGHPFHLPPAGRLAPPPPGAGEGDAVDRALLR